MVAGQLTGAVEQHPQAAVVTPLGGQGLRHPEKDHDHEQPGEGGHDSQDAAPPDGLDEHAPENRRHHRGDPLNRHDDAEGPGGGDPTGTVGDDCPPQDHAGRSPEPLEEAGDEENGQARGQGSADAGGQGEHTAPQQQGTPADAIGQDPDTQLAERDAHEERGHRQLNAGGGDAQVIGHLGEGRQVGVGGQRCDGRERGQSDEERGGEGRPQPVVGRSGRRSCHALRVRRVPTEASVRPCVTRCTAWPDRSAQ